jgi:hypothetical protein
MFAHSMFAETLSPNAHKTPPWNKNPINVFPNLLQFRQKNFIILNMSQLVRVLIVPWTIQTRKGVYAYSGKICIRNIIRSEIIKFLKRLLAIEYGQTRIPVL